MKNYFDEEVNKWLFSKDKSISDVFFTSCRRFAKEWPHVRRPRKVDIQARQELDPQGKDYE